MCWIAPKSKIVNQLFGVTTGLGMSVITFDWSQITWISSPLIIPWWAEVNIFVGFVLLYWIVVPILYYTNVSSVDLLRPLERCELRCLAVDMALRIHANLNLRKLR